MSDATSEAPEYTPTTGEVRELWIDVQDITHGEGQDGHGDEFDRWLTAHDAEVIAEWQKTQQTGVTDAEVEAAARAMYASEHARKTRKYGTQPEYNWEWIASDYRVDARAALEAARKAGQA